MPTVIQLPSMPEGAPVIDTRTGQLTPDWLRYLKALDTIIRAL